MPKLVHGSRFTVHRIKKTVNCQLSTVNWRLWCQGYTLIEFLVAIGILVLAIGSSLAFLTSSLKSSNQANVNAEVKQNGQVVLDSLEKQIRNSTGAELIGGSHIRLTRSNSANDLHIKCFDDGLPGAKTVNGSIRVLESSELLPADASFTTSTSVTNLDPISGVDIQSCNFNVPPATSGAGSPPVVSLSFLVNQGISAPSRADFLANVQFQTTISLRKY